MYLIFATQLGLLFFKL